MFKGYSVRVSCTPLLHVFNVSHILVQCCMQMGTTHRGTCKCPTYQTANQKDQTPTKMFWCWQASLSQMYRGICQAHATLWGCDNSATCYWRPNTFRCTQYCQTNVPGLLVSERKTVQELNAPFPTTSFATQLRPRSLKLRMSACRNIRLLQKSWQSDLQIAGGDGIG